MSGKPGEITKLLLAMEAGQAQARELLWHRVYEELRAMAQAQMAREAPGRTIQSTALVNEAYLRLTGGEEVAWQNRRHFFGAAANAMRRIMIDDARRRGRAKHGGGRRRVGDVATLIAERDPEILLDLDAALDRLRSEEPLMAQIVELRYFAELSIDATAEVVGRAPRTIDNKWSLAKAWLHRELSGQLADSPQPE